MDLKSILSLAQTLTGGAVLIAVLWAIIVKKLVPGWTYDAMAKERDNYLNRYLEKVDPGYKDANSPGATTGH